MAEILEGIRVGSKDNLYSKKGMEDGLADIVFNQFRFERSKNARVHKQHEIEDMRAFVNKVIQRGKPWIDPEFPPEY